MFETPQVVNEYLDQTWRKPLSNFVNFSDYYAGLDTYYIDYMTRVIRPCIAAATAVSDNYFNSGVNLEIGHSIKKAAVNLIKGERVYFDGSDAHCKILSDYWADSVNFNGFLEAGISYMCEAGTSFIKLNKDRRGRCVPVATRVDRAYAAFDENGDVCRITLMNTLLSKQSYGASVNANYWLVEERYYQGGKPYVKYKVHMKQGTSTSEVLPSLYSTGIDIKYLDDTAQALIKSKGITLNKPMLLPFRDGLGVWALRLTNTNSCVPGLALGDPLLYGALDIIWAINMVFSGSIVDVILGKGKVLVPKKFLRTIMNDLTAAGVTASAAQKAGWSDRWNTEDETLVYIQTEHDQDFKPQAVQFDIRADKYKGMLEIYLQQLVAHVGFAPSTIFPFLSDNSVKTAREVTSEENLTRATVRGIHSNIEPVLNRVINEVLYQFYKDIGVEYTDAVKIRLSDYIGNTLSRDENIRANLQAGVTSKEKAVREINNLSAEETNEMLAKIEQDQKTQLNAFNDSNYFGDENS